MARRSRSRVPVNTFQFSPHQIHPRTTLLMAFGSVALSVRTQIVRWSRMIHEHGWSVVLVGFELEYPRPLVFQTAGDWLTIDGLLVLRAQGKLIEHRAEIAGDDDAHAGTAVRVRTLWRPVKLTGTEELSGLPAPADAWLSGRFEGDERDDAPVARDVPIALAQLAEGYEAAGQGEHHLTVSRDECELADQWQFASLAGYVARSREATALESTSPIVKQGLHRPMGRMLAELRGPLYLGSRVRVRSEALHRRGEVVFRHHVTDVSVTGAELPCATVLEFFPREGGAS